VIARAATSTTVDASMARRIASAKSSPATIDS